MTKMILTKAKIIMEKMVLNNPIMQLKITLKMPKSNYSPKKTKSNDVNVYKIQQKKTRIQIVGDSTVNGNEEPI